MPLKSYGLEGVVAAESELSCIDGKKGILEYRGYDIHDLAKYSNYEEVVYLLWYGKLPTEKELKDFKTELAERRDLPDELITLLYEIPKSAHPMVVLRTAVSFMGSFEDDPWDLDDEKNLERSKDMTAKIPTVVAYFDRIRNSREIVYPDKKLSHAGNFLYMLRGEKPAEIEERALDIDLILHAEHTMNASTFTARVCASTLSDMYSGIVAAIGALMGPLHGGASQRVMEMLMEIESPERVEEYVKRELESGRRIMGFGHRVYKTVDPRAEELRELAKSLSEHTGERKWFEISEKLREVVWREKGLNPNVDFYAATVYANLNIPVDMFVCIFAMARIAGWTAHMMEQYRDNRLIRPLQKYVGAKNLKYIPIEKRK